MKTQNSICSSLFLAAVLVLSTAASFAQDQNRNYAIDDLLKIQRLSDKVVIVRTGVTNFDAVTAIATQKGIVVIDAGCSVTLTTKYKKIIEREFNRNDFIYVITTHSDMDHVAGNQVFPDAKIIGHENCSEAMVGFWKHYPERKKEWISWLEQSKKSIGSIDRNSDEWKQLNYEIKLRSMIIDDFDKRFRLKLPVITFNDRLSLNLGDITLHLVYFGKAHRESDVVIYVPEEKILFIGDLFDKTGVVDFSHYGKDNAARWYSVLNELLTKENEIRYVINGHDGSTLANDVLMRFYDDIKKFWNGYNEGKDFYNYEAAIQIFQESGLHGLLAEFNMLRTTKKDKFFFIEGNFNAIGYGLLDNKKIEAALEVFKMNAELFPESWKVYDSLGEAYMTAGSKELAIENYEKSLKLDPKSQSAKQALKKLRGEN